MDAPSDTPDDPPGAAANDVPDAQSGEPQRAELYAYFMIRVHRNSLATPGCVLAGLVEQLATGEKHCFASAEELIRIVCRPPDAMHTMGRRPESRDR